MHGLSIQTSHFTCMDRANEKYLGVRGWNQRLAQSLQITGKYMGAVVVMQLGCGVGGPNGAVLGGGIDYPVAHGALESVVDGMLSGGDSAEEVEKKKNKPESMKAVVRLIGRRELGNGYDELLQKQYLMRLQQQFLRDLTTKV
ncbi:UNVERIFIED_CONTAM: hypothetical protein HDU68_009162 [Siphonaria sp. JEL0065]|nr:hypothetical protein HDU68_009162 [Siphonaria sp. JEL0065]